MPQADLKAQTPLIIGRGSGLARAIALAARDAGAQIIAAGRGVEALSAAYAGEPGVARKPARGRLADPDRDAIRLSFDTKVIGPLMLAKHLAPRMNKGRSFVIFSGVAAAKIAVGTMGVAITNATADTLARSLARSRRASCSP